MKQTQIVLIIFVIVVLLCFGLYVYAATYIFPIAPYWITQLPPNPPSPKIKYGEFDFKLEYEISGKRYVVEDTLVCEFDGFEVRALGGSKERKWKSRLKSGRARIVLLRTDDVEIFYDPGLSNSQAAIYMGDNKIYHGDNGSTFPNAWCRKISTDKNEKAYIIYAHEMLSEYKLQIVSWQPSDPIENDFSWFYFIGNPIIKLQ